MSLCLYTRVPCLTHDVYVIRVTVCICMYNISYTRIGITVCIYIYISILYLCVERIMYLYYCVYARARVGVCV